MTNLISNVAEMKDVLLSPSTGAAVAATTITSGVSTRFDWIPGDIGLLSSLVGATRSAVLIVTHVLKFYFDTRKRFSKEKG